MTPPKPAKTPCPTCPYRRDVPSGIWDASEYEKLLAYDGETGEQLINGGTSLFMCHQQNGHLCSGWVACHDTRHLLALRLHKVDRSTFTYKSPVPVFASGAEAAAHGMAEIERPGNAARSAIAKVEKRQRKVEGMGQ